MSDLLDDIEVPADPTRQSIVVVSDRGRHATFTQIGGDERLVADLLTELRQLRGEGARPSNGHARAKAFVHVCAACGREFESNRRQLPGKRMWCGRPECRKEANALRSQEYRLRKGRP